MTACNIKQDDLDVTVNGGNKNFATIPYHVVNPDGSAGMAKRQCTSNYKVTPVHKFLRRKIMKLKYRQRAPKELQIQQWLGISADEMRRMRQPRDKWLSNYYPLCGIEYFPDGTVTDSKVRTKRHQCIQWMENKGLRKPPRSACIGCPFRDNKSWREIKDGSAEEWEEVCQFDEAIRQNKKMEGLVYLHKDRVPLREADIDTLEEKGQQSLFGNDCEGMCGI